MRDSVRRQYEAVPAPSPVQVPVGPGQLDRIDDGLHYGWSWHRHRYCYRRGDHLRILDAGCGTGISTLALARLNPGSTVLGLDGSARSLLISAERAQASALAGVEFREHDLDRPLPAGLGPFDFIVCRGVLGQAEDPVRILKHLAAVLDHRGLLYITLPTEYGRQPARQFRQAVDALAGPGASLEERAAIGVDLFRTLRPDHPIRRYDAALGGNDQPSTDRIVSTYLVEDERDWTLPEAVRALREAGLQFLYASSRRPWQPDRVLAPNTATDHLRQRVDALPPDRLALLIEAIDPTLHADEYRVYACLAEFEPHVPSWAEEQAARPEMLDRLVPHRTGLAWPDASATPSAPGRVAYRTVTGAVGELDPRADLLYRAIDDSRSCGAIAEEIARQSGVNESAQSWQQRWLDLANNGFLLLEPPDPRQHIDCRHLGPVRDRLDCACPRRWIRACELHQFCTIAEVDKIDIKYPALSDAMVRMAITEMTACATCPDYDPEDEHAL